MIQLKKRITICVWAALFFGALSIAHGEDRRIASEKPLIIASYGPHLEIHPVYTPSPQNKHTEASLRLKQRLAMEEHRERIRYENAVKQYEKNARLRSVRTASSETSPH
jgi:hypothetical protein